MRRCACVLCVVTVVLLGCGPKITEEEVREAVMVAYQAVLTGSIAVGADLRTPGVRPGETAGALQLWDFDGLSLRGLGLSTF